MGMPVIVGSLLVWWSYSYQVVGGGYVVLRSGQALLLSNIMSQHRYCMHLIEV